MRRIKTLVEKYMKRYHTRNPFKLAQYLNIEVQIGNLGSPYGYYIFLKNHKCIFLNENVAYNEQRMVMAHELGHAILHPKEICCFTKEKTLLLNSQIEKEANYFAAELLISDQNIAELAEYSLDEIANMMGYQKRLIELKINQIS